MSIKNRLNRVIKKQKKKLRAAAFKRMGVKFDFMFLGFHNHFKNKSVKSLSVIELKKRSMTNWQNSQWLRAGGHVLGEEADLINIDKFLALTK